MKKLFVTVLLFLPVTAGAQDMNQQNMQNMMAEMQKLGACMQSIDQQELEALGSNADRFEADMKVLCKDGKRDEAQEKAMVFSKKMMNSSAIKDLHKCTEKVSASVRGMMPNMNPDEMIKDYSNHHICDEI